MDTDQESEIEDRRSQDGPSEAEMEFSIGVRIAKIYTYTHCCTHRWRYVQKDF